MSFTPLSKRHEEIGAIVVDCAFRVHKELGPGLLEKFYEECLCYELEQAGLQVSRQVCLPFMYRNVILCKSLRMDIVIEEMVIAETKAVEQINPVWEAQILSHLKITGYRLGFLINFNVPLIKQGIKRIVL